VAAVDLRFGAAPIAGPPYNLVFGAAGGAVTPTANVNLVFRAARIAGPPCNLVFGAAGGAAAPEDLSLSLQATLPGLTLRASLTALDGLSLQAALPGLALRASLTALDGVTLQAAALLPGLRLSGKLGYDNRVTRYLHRPALAPQQVAAPARRAVGGAWHTSRSEQCGATPSWCQALPVRRAVDVSHCVATARALAVAPDWQLARALSLQAAILAQVADRLAQARQSAWQTAQAVGIRTAGAFEVADRLLHTAAALHQVASQRGYVAAGKMGRANHIDTARLIPWQLARWPAVGKGVWPPVVVTPAGHVGSTHLLFQRKPLRGLPLHLVFSAYPSGRAPLPPARVVIPFLKAYVTINLIVLRRVSDGASIPAFGFNMALDWQSWTWSWSTSIPVNALALVKPGISGDPVEVEAVVNGVPYRLCVEGPDRQRQFAKGRVGIKGRGTAAILDAPYAPTLHFGNAEARTAQQLMLDALTINGVGIGWDVDFGLTDWLVPGNAWSHQGNYISAILDIAGAAGGYVQPHDTEQTLRILPKYPVAPWDWGDVVPDFELPGIATVEGITWQRKAAYNRIHVSGIGAGVLGQVTRAGTAGDSVAPMVTHSLITHADAARQRGLAELAGAASQASVSLKLPVLAETGLILPGKFVRYGNGSETHLGLVRGISLDWSRPVLRQTLSVETHV